MDWRDPALTGILIGTFHLLRIICGGLLAVVSYRFAAAFIRAPGWRLFAAALMLAGGGLGWLLLLSGNADWLGSPPPEFFIPEGFGFLALYGLPHLALARSALLVGLLALLQAAALPRGGWRCALAAGACWLVVGLCVPFYLLVIYLILAAWGLAAWIGGRVFPRRLAQAALLPALLTLPLLAYYTLVFARNPAFAQWSAQNLLPSPHPLHYLLAYGLLAALGLVGGRRAWRRLRRGALPAALLIGWPLLVPLLVYLPVNVQRRLAEAVIAPLAVLAALGLAALVRRRLWRRLRPALAFSLFASAGLILTGGLFSALNPALPVFRPAAELEMLAWLDAQTEADRVALAAFETGNILPAYTSLRPYVGHGPETLDALGKTAAVQRFFADAMPAAERAALLASVNVRYILYGPLERALHPTAAENPAWAADLPLRYDADGYRVYEALLHAPASQGGRSSPAYGWLMRP
jgi:hypothetical protein